MLRAPAALPEDPDDRAWNWADQAVVGLAPLSWHEDAVFTVTLSALHDGERIAFCLRWPDESGGTRLFTAAPLSDAVALQFSTALGPPLFGMGSREQRTNIWHWRSTRIEEIAGALDLLDPTAHVLAQSRAGDVRLDAPVYRPLYGIPAVSLRVDRVHAGGIPRSEPEREQAEVAAAPRWSDGEWRVVLTRAMDPVAPDETPLVPGSRAQVACAVWNGAAGDHGPRKSISVWQELVIAP